MRKYWERRAGQLVVGMLERREFAEECLRHSDPVVRAVAIEILSFRWETRAGDPTAELFEKMAIEEPSTEPRCAAIGATGDCYRGTDDISIGRFLAAIVHNEREHEACRECAYMALYSLRGLLPWSVEAGPPVRFRIPEDIDWSFVDSFLIVGRTPSPRSPREMAADLLPEPTRSNFGLFHEGCDAYARGDYRACVDWLTRFIAAGARFPGAFAVRGGAYVKLGMFDEAIDDFTLAIQLSPRSGRAYHSRSIAYRLKGFSNLADADQRQAELLYEAEKRVP